MVVVWLRPMRAVPCCLLAALWLTGGAPPGWSATLAAASAADAQPAAASAAPEPATEEAPASTVGEEITVVAPEIPAKTEISADVRSLPANAAELGRLALQQAIYREAGEVLRSLPGMDFVYYGQGGIPSGPSVRGYTDRNFGQDIAGFLDGIPLNLFGFVASHGALDLTPVYVDALERVELIRGPFDARYGDFQRGASLNFITRDGTAQPSVSLSGGSYGARRVAVTYGNAQPGTRKISLFANAQANSVDGYSDNQRVEQFNTFNKLLVPMGTGELAVTVQAFSSDWDAPSYLDLALIERGVLDDQQAVNPTDGGNLDSGLLAFRYRRGVDSGRPLTATLYVSQRDWRRFRSDFLISPTQTQVRQIDERVTMGYRVEQSLGFELGGRPLQVLVGSNLQRDDAETRQAATLNRAVIRLTDDVDELLTNFGLFAQGQWQALDRLKFVVGARYSDLAYELDDNLRARGTFVESYSANKVSPNFGVAWSPVDRFEVYGHFAQGMRSPTPRSEVRNSVSSIGRVDIAETENTEFGASLRLGEAVTVRADVWRADNSNEIRGIPPGGVEFESLGKSRREGSDFEVDWYPGWGLHLRGAASFVDAKLLTPATPSAVHFPDVAESVHQVGGEKQWLFDGGFARSLTLSADLAFYGEKNLNTTGTIRSEPYERVNSRLSFNASESYRFWLGGFWYPGNRYGESAFLFGSKVGVRANPRVSLEAGVGYSF